MWEFFQSLSLIETVLGSAVLALIGFIILFSRRAFDHMETMNANHNEAFNRNSEALDKNSDNLLKGLEKISDAQKDSGDAIARSIERALLIQTIKSNGNNQVVVDNKRAGDDPDNGGV